MSYIPKDDNAKGWHEYKSTGWEGSEPLDLEADFAIATFFENFAFKSVRRHRDGKTACGSLITVQFSTGNPLVKEPDRDLNALKCLKKNLVAKKEVQWVSITDVRRAMEEEIKMNLKWQSEVEDMYEW